MMVRSNNFVMPAGQNKVKLAALLVSQLLWIYSNAGFRSFSVMMTAVSDEVIVESYIFAVTWLRDMTDNTLVPVQP